jgi:epoxyqueuosine reductase
MTSNTLTTDLINYAESFAGIQAGIARLKDVLDGASCKAEPDNHTKKIGLNPAQDESWPIWAQSILVLGLHHPEDDPRLDYWERGNTWGNRRLRDIGDMVQHWLRWTHHLASHHLPYHVEKGGVFLKDAAVLAGLGIIGRNNLLIHPQWGPRIRLRAILLENEFPPTAALTGFSPCDDCRIFCQKACPRKAFPKGAYNRQLCNAQMNADLQNKVPYGELQDNGKRERVIRYCRLCETACPAGA